jgi:hypothetical protein
MHMAALWKNTQQRHHTDNGQYRYRGLMDRHPHEKLKQWERNNRATRTRESQQDPHNATQENPAKHEIPYSKGIV